MQIEELARTSRNQQLALVNVRRENAALRKALVASDKERFASRRAIIAWYENTEGDTDIPEELALIDLAKKFKAKNSP